MKISNYNKKDWKELAIKTMVSAAGVAIAGIWSHSVELGLTAAVLCGVSLIFAIVAN